MLHVAFCTLQAASSCYMLQAPDAWLTLEHGAAGRSLILQMLHAACCSVHVAPAHAQGCVHFRNPVELGGSYWLFNAVMSQVSCVASVVLYNRYYVGGAKIAGPVLYGIVGALGAVWLVSFCAFLLIIKREYVHTFVSLQTGSDYTISYFRDNVANEARRIRILFDNERTWCSIRGAVKWWVRSR
jgi:hypothetical protein